MEDYSNFNKYEQQSMSETTVPSGNPKCFSRFLRVRVAQSLIFRLVFFWVLFSLIGPLHFTSSEGPSL